MEQKKKNLIDRRLDSILITVSSFFKDCPCRIVRLGFSDHKAFALNIDFSSFQRGPSFYKFNFPLLHDFPLFKKLIPKKKE